VEKNLQNCEEGGGEASKKEYQKNGSTIKVLKLEQMQKIKHFSISVPVGGNGYFVVMPSVVQRWDQ